MISMSLELLTTILAAPSPGIEREFCGVTIDSRKNCDGKLFIAIRGEHFDGHDYVEAARGAGAAAALVEHKLECDIPQIVVENCKQAMIDLAREWRRRCAATVIALTGSNGKTTVKEMIFHILHKRGPTHATQGNFNNDIGVPLTLFELAPDDRFAVIEMGANHQGEIACLATIAEPDIVYVNNVAAAHLAGFGSVEGVIAAKGELYDYCTDAQIAVFNNDEMATRQWRQNCTATRQLSCALDAEADVTAQWQGLDNGLELAVKYRDQTQTVSLCVFGEHNARNALAAITIAVAAGINFNDAVKGLAGFSGVAGRLQLLGGPRHSRIINDSYNANPGSLEAGLKVLCGLQGEAWLALGDMGELGDEAQELHIQAATRASELGVVKLFALGPLSCRASQVFEENGHCFDRVDKMAETILEQIHKDVNLLVKGSRAAGMEKLVDRLIHHEQIGEGLHAV